MNKSDMKETRMKSSTKIKAADDDNVHVGMLNMEGVHSFATWMANSDIRAAAQSEGNWAIELAGQSVVLKCTKIRESILVDERMDAGPQNMGPFIDDTLLAGRDYMPDVHIVYTQSTALGSDDANIRSSSFQTQMQAYTGSNSVGRMNADAKASQAVRIMDALHNTSVKLNPQNVWDLVVRNLTLWGLSTRVNRVNPIAVTHRAFPTPADGQYKYDWQLNALGDNAADAIEGRAIILEFKASEAHLIETCLLLLTDNINDVFHWDYPVAAGATTSFLHNLNIRRPSVIICDHAGTTPDWIMENGLQYGYVAVVAPAGAPPNPPIGRGFYRHALAAPVNPPVAIPGGGIGVTPLDVDVVVQAMKVIARAVGGQAAYESAVELVTAHGFAVPSSANGNDLRTRHDHHTAFQMDGSVERPCGGNGACLGQNHRNNVTTEFAELIGKTVPQIINMPGMSVAHRTLVSSFASGCRDVSATPEILHPLSAAVIIPGAPPVAAGTRANANEVIVRADIGASELSSVMCAMSDMAQVKFGYKLKQSTMMMTPGSNGDHTPSVCPAAQLVLGKIPTNTSLAMFPANIVRDSAKGYCGTNSELSAIIQEVVDQAQNIDVEIMSHGKTTSKRDKADDAAGFTMELSGGPGMAGHTLTAFIPMGGVQVTDLSVVAEGVPDGGHPYRQALLVEPRYAARTAAARTNAAPVVAAQPHVKPDVMYADFDAARMVDFQAAARDASSTNIRSAFMSNFTTEGPKYLRVQALKRQLSYTRTGGLTLKRRKTTLNTITKAPVAANNPVNATKSGEMPDPKKAGAQPYVGGTATAAVITGGGLPAVIEASEE